MSGPPVEPDDNDLIVALQCSQINMPLCQPAGGDRRTSSRRILREAVEAVRRGRRLADWADDFREAGEVFIARGLQRGEISRRRPGDQAHALKPVLPPLSPKANSQRNEREQFGEARHVSEEDRQARRSAVGGREESSRLDEDRSRGGP